MTRLRVGIALVVLLLGAAAAAVFWSGVRSLDAPLRLGAPLRFKVTPGASFAHVATELATQGVVAQPRAWILYARLKRLAPAVKAGEYEIQPGTTPRELLLKMVNGQVLLHSLTIVDGWRVQDLLDALRRSPDIVSTLPEQTAPSVLGATIMTRLGAPGIDAEGQFLPETYRFIGGTTDIELLRQAHAALVRELDAAWTDRAPDLRLHSANELLIMASIVQKESGLPQELARIAGLYLHRLGVGMRLQADPTVIYGLGEQYDGDIHTVDLRTDGPYNTYTRAGLPPTPIALAGAAVIRATARPEKTDALYFVASTKGDGSHIFSATLEQHNAAVAAYVAHQRKAAEGSPR
ncbi:MAG TPA: endolytic transglycosylase MltG [Steroidobacteraceae bacterium]|nr:endolytic transglycosylase MltG [Steroidobacteraceae bacterium]